MKKYIFKVCSVVISLLFLFSCFVGCDDGQDDDFIAQDIKSLILMTSLSLVRVR